MASLFVPSFIFVSIISLSSAFQGDLTYYDPEVGLTACGTSHRRTEFIAALSFTDFIDTPNPNDSPSCDMCALIRGNNGASALVRIKDKCAGCQPGDIDVTPTVFQLFAPLSAGRVRVSWEFVSCSGGGGPSPPSPPSGSTSNYCGRSYTDAKSCRQSCPRGVDRECPAGQRCFASISCTGSPPSSGGTSNYCGTSYTDAKACRQTCPNGVDRECPSGQRCFASIPC